MPTNTQMDNSILLEIQKAYDDARVVILSTLASSVDKSISGQAGFMLGYLQKLLAEVDRVISSTTKEVNPKYSKALERMYGKAKDSVSRDLNKSLEGILYIVPAQVTRLVLEINNKLNNASFRILRNVDDAYRSIVAESTKGLVIGSQTQRETAQIALNRFADRGITGFVDSAGRNWDISTYTDMAVRTVATQVSLQGHIDRQLELGEDLMIVSSFGNTCPLCSPWEGKVLSIRGNNPKYSSLGTAKQAGLFHPNCKHSLMPYTEGVTRLVQEPYDAETYRAQQQQRYNERQIRKWKDREAVSLDDKERDYNTRKIRDWQKAQREHISQYNLRRNYNREGTMVGRPSDILSGTGG